MARGGIEIQLLRWVDAGVVDLATRLKPGDSVVKSPIARTPSGRTI